MDRLGIGFLGGFGLPPVEFVNLTADLGCRCMSAVVQGLPLVPLDYPPYSLKDDVALRGELLAAMNHRGVTISLGDGFLVLPDADISTCATDLDVLAELGVPRINVVSLDPDLGRTFDQFGTLTDLAAQRGLQTVVEPVPGLTVGDLPTALAADIVIELEVPRRSLAFAGVSPIDRLRPCVEAAGRLLSEVERRQ